MAKIVKRKKQKKNTAFLNFSIWMFMISATLYLASSIFLRTYNNALSAQTQQMEADILSLIHILYRLKGQPSFRHLEKHERY